MKRGDSLWTIAERGNLPIWLVAQYNPDADFNDMRPGTSSPCRTSRPSIASSRGVQIAYE